MKISNSNFKSLLHTSLRWLLLAYFFTLVFILFLLTFSMILFYLFDVKTETQTHWFLRWLLLR